MSLVRLSSIAEAKIASKNIMTETNILVNGSVITDCSSFNYNIDKSFGIASFTFSIVNREQLYSVGGSLEIKQGDSVKVQRSIILNDGSKETFETNWVVRQVNPSTKSTEDIIEITCLDFLVKAGETDIDLGLLEGTKVNVHDMPGESYNLGVPLIESSPHPDTLPSNFAQFFDFGYYDTCATSYFVSVNNIAPWPAPIIRIVTKTSQEKGIQDSFEINYETGQLILPAPICTDDFEIWAVFSYYSAGLRAEDVIKQILLEPDGYGNTIYSSGDFETTLNETTGESIDSLIRDVTNTKKWWLTFSNILDTLAEVHFSIPVGGGSITEINEEVGYIILENVIASDSNVICTKNYIFSTLQYTGINIPFIRLSHMEIANRFDAISKVKEFLAPNYILQTLGDNKLWGRYLTQKIYNSLDSKKGADYKLDLIGSLSYNLDEDIYTHVKVFGKSNNPHNVMQDPGVTYNASYFGVHFTTIDLLNFSIDYDNWDIPSLMLKSIYDYELLFYPQKPIVTINGNSLMFNEVKNATGWGRIKKTLGEESYFIGYTFPLYIDKEYPIIFWEGDKEIAQINMNDLKLENDDIGNAYYAYYPIWSSDQISIRYPDFKITANDYLKILDYKPIIISVRNNISKEYEWVKILVANHSQGSPYWDLKHEICGKDGRLQYLGTYTDYARETWDALGLGGGIVNLPTMGSDKGWWLIQVNFHWWGHPPYNNNVSSGTNWRGKSRIDYYFNNEKVYTQTINNIIPIMKYSGGENQWYFNFSLLAPKTILFDRAVFWFYPLGSFIKEGTITLGSFISNNKSSLTGYFIDAGTQHTQESDRYKLHDKNPLTQLQIGYKSDPSSLVLISFDLQEEKKIDIIDFSTGFYKIGGNRFYDFSNIYTIEYSLDNVDWYPICKEASDFSIGAGETQNFEELGEEFYARYLRIVLNKAEEKIIGEVPIWPVSITEFSAYENTVLIGEAKLCENEEDESDTLLYDSRGVLPRLGDVLYKDNNISEYLNTQTKIDKRAKDLLREYIKGTTRVKASCFARPDLQIGDTVWIFDNINGIDRNYFVESIQVDSGDMANLVLAYYALT